MYNKKSIFYFSKTILLIICTSLLAATVGAQDTTKSSYVMIKSLMGKVVDSSNNGIPYVSISDNNGKNLAVTDSMGTFMLKNIHIHQKIDINSIGYLPKKIEIADTGFLEIHLYSIITNMDEVVVIGYGTQKRRDVLGAQVTFNAKGIEEKPISRVEEALVGQVAGVQVTQQSGMPGAGISITVRGQGSLSAGKEPLYVIDGFPLDVVSQSSDGSIGNSPLNNLNPDDIESIQILKDAAAAAIYGSRAANGVVLILTKSGKSGQAKITLNVNTGLSSVFKKQDLLTADEWVKVASTIADSNWVASAVGRIADQTEAERVAILGSRSITYVKDQRWGESGHSGLKYINWQDVIYRKALFQNYSLSASGGSSNVNYFISGNYMNQDGILITSNYKTYGLRANVEAKASKKLKFGINLAPTYATTSSPKAEGKDNILMKTFLYTPVVEDTAGLYSGAFENYGYNWSSGSFVSPYAYLLNSYNKYATSRILGTVYAVYSISNDLSFKTSVDYDGYNRITKYYVSDQVVAGAQTYRDSLPGTKSSGTYATIIKRTFVNENILTYNHTFLQKHHINALIGHSYNRVHNENSSIATAGGYANDIVQTLNNAISNSSGVTVTGTTSEFNTTLLSFFGRLQYDFDGKYLFSASVRKDASSVFGVNNRWGTFPSLSLGYNISNENFFRDNVQFINDLKLRLSWGKSGNNAITNYATYSTLTSSNYSFDGTTVAGQIPSSISNPNLKWETSNTYDFGLDVAVLDRRISFTFDAYRKISSNLLMYLPVLETSGFSSALQNVGKVKAEGLEFAINSTNINGKYFSWATTANISFNQNKVLDLGANQSSIQISSNYSGGNPPFLLQVGLPMFSYNITRIDGILTQEDMDNSSVAKVSKETVGDPKFFDKDADGSITSSDRIVYGHPNPNYTWGLTNTFNYKKMSLSIQVYGQQGGKILSYLGRGIDYSGSTASNILGIWRNHWSTENQNYNAPRGKLNAKYTPPYVTSDWIYSTDFWRIQAITFGYNLVENGKHMFKTMKAYISARNLFGKDKYYGGVNPEAQNTNNSGNSAYPLPGDYGGMPLSRTISLGLNINF